jgi:hypothetical protein
LKEGGEEDDSDSDHEALDPSEVTVGCACFQGGEEEERKKKGGGEARRLKTGKREARVCPFNL